MNLPLSCYASTGLLNTLAFGGITAFVLIKQPHSKVARLFAVFAALVAWWSWLYFLWLRVTDDPIRAGFLERSCMIPVMFMPAVFLHFADELTHRRLRQRLHVLNYIVSLFLASVVYSDLFATGVRRVAVFPYCLIPGPMLGVHLAHMFTSVGYAHWLIYWAARSGSSQVRKQLTWILVGCGIAYLAGFSNYVIWYGIPYPPVVNSLVSAFVAAAAYAIVRHQFLDVRVVVTRTGLLLAVYLVVLGAPFLVGLWGRGWLERLVGAQWWLVPLGLSTALATLGPFAYAYLRRQAEERLLAEQRRYQRALLRAAEGMTQVRDLTRLVRLIVRVVSRSVGLAHASLLLWDKASESYTLRATYGPQQLAVQSGYRLARADALVQWLLERRRVLSPDELTDAERPVVETTARLSAALVVPGFIAQDLIGFLVLGEKRSGAGYSTEDLHAFATLAHEAAVALENAMSYEELLKVNEQLRRAYERLATQERLAAAGQFAAGMAHEIRNPLTAIKTFAQYLPEKYQDPVFREKFFRIVQAEIERINQLVLELMNFAKPAPLQLQPVQLAELLEETLMLLSNQFLKQQVAVATEFNEDGASVQADPRQLRQVFLNLLINSLEAMEGGGRLAVATVRQDGVVAVRIADTGCGIAEADQGRLFDPFYTTKERGMGLGLAVVKAIVERHGGQLTFHSRPGNGTAVVFSLPIASPNEP
ncbi:MAG: GAF domain-containing protein [Candidatus Omnitrophica bacterium]|nr:GAF domain-containing protein [Candidatus Omnitrophota bacterium]